jgi:group I intron endonuclease
MDYVIYKLTNLVTGKCYVGHTKDLKARLSSHKCCAGNCRLLHNSIRKHGWSKFSHEIVEHTTEDKALTRETFFILKFNTLAPFGYNLVLEDTNSGRKFSLESNIERSATSYESKKNRNIANKFIGVSPRKNNRFYTHISFRRKIFTKYFKDEIEAAEAYDRVILYLRGANARINFVDNFEQYLSEDLKLFLRIFAKNALSLPSIHLFGGIRAMISGLPLTSTLMEH